MEYLYYIVRIKDMVVLDGAEDMVMAIRKAQQINDRIAIIQGCVITEMGEDVEETDSQDPELLEPEVLPTATMSKTTEPMEVSQDVISSQID